MLVSGLTFLIGLGLQTISTPWGLAIILLCVLIFFYALSISLLARGVLVGRRVYYQSHCSRCLYDLSAIESNTCPECGRVITPIETDPS